MGNPSDVSGYDTYSVLAQNSENTGTIKSKGGRVYGWHIINLASTPRYVKLYNNANPDRTITPRLRIGVQSPGSAIGGVSSVSYPNGIAFPDGIGVRIVTGVADLDSVAPTANDVAVNIFYK